MALWYGENHPPGLESVQNPFTDRKQDQWFQGLGCRGEGTDWEMPEEHFRVMEVFYYLIRVGGFPDVYVCQNLSNYMLKMCAFYYM